MCNSKIIALDVDSFAVKNISSSVEIDQTYCLHKISLHLKMASA